MRAAVISRSGLARKCDSGTVDPADAVVLELLERERLEEVVPDDVAREQALGLLGEHDRVGGRCSVFDLRPIVWNAVGEAADAAHAQLERLDEVPVLVAQPPRRVEVLGGGDVLLLLAGDAAAGADRSARPTGPASSARSQRLAVRARLRRDRADVVHVVARTTSCFDEPAQDWISSAKTSTRKTTKHDEARAAARAAPRRAAARARRRGAAGTPAPRQRAPATAAPPRSPARPRRSRTGCRRRAGPSYAESTDVRSSGKGLLLGTK